MLVVIMIAIAPENRPIYAAPSAQSLEPTELEAFMDGLLTEQMTAYHIPGATVSVVKDGQLVLAKGYGYANVEQRAPVVADRTLFHLASVSKLFVWTAVMQLVEQRKLDLNADVNTYLKDFQIPSTYPQPITLAHLMTHTAGFEERSLGTSARRAQDLAPLNHYLATHIPARVFPPGELTAYSNYGSALAGYIVGQVAGMPFDQYVEEHIFQPLQMQHSTFRQPFPPALSDNLAAGYTDANGHYEPHDTEWTQFAPAAALHSTAADMANFMIAQLQNGRFQDRRILQEATAKEMHEQNFTNDPRVNGFAHGFLVATVNDQHLIWHGGDMLYFHCALLLLPERNMGLFVAYNSAGGNLAVLNTVSLFMDHYFPVAQPALATSNDAGDDSADYAGTFFPARAEHTTAGKLVALLQSIRVTPASAHQLEVSLGFPAQITWRYIEVAPGLFRSVDVPPAVYGDLVFRTNNQGRAHYLFQQNNPTTAYVKAPWYAEPGFNLALLVFCVALFLSVLVWWPIGVWMRRRFCTGVSFAARLAGGVAILISLLSLLFLIGFGVVFANPQTVFGLSTWAPYLFLLPLAIALLALGMLILTVAAWRRRDWSLPGRIHYTLVTLAALAFTGWLAYWHLWVMYLY